MSTRENIELVKSMFPHLSLSEIEQDLRFTGNVDQTVNRIFDGQFLAGTAKSSNGTKPAVNPPATSATPRASEDYERLLDDFVDDDDDDDAIELPPSLIQKPLPAPPRQTGESQANTQPSQGNEKVTLDLTGDDIDAPKPKKRQRTASESSQSQEAAPVGLTRQKSKEEALSSVTLVFDNSILTTKKGHGAEWLAALRGTEALKVELEGLPIPGSIELRRVDPSEPQRGVTENYVIYREEIGSLLEKIIGKPPNPPPLTPFLKEILKKAPGKTLIYILEGFKDYLKAQARELHKEFKEAVEAKTRDHGEKREEIKRNRINIENQLVWLQMESKCKIIQTQKIADSAHSIRLLVDAVAKGQDLKSHDLGFFAEGESRSGSTLTECWQLQLETVNSVSPAVAKAVVSRYPTARKLIQAYRSLPEEGAKLLLSEIVVERDQTARRVGKANSEKIYSALMETDPNAPAG